MRRTIPYSRLLAATALSVFAFTASAQKNVEAPHGSAYSSGAVVDQTHPRYIRFVESTREADQALRRAVEALRHAQSLHQFEGLDMNALAMEVARVQGALDPVLHAEQRRLRYQTLQPDGVFMRPNRPQ